MINIEDLRHLDGSAFENAARTLVSGNRSELVGAVRALVLSDDRADAERIAALLSVAPIGGTSGGDYYDARFGSSFGKRCVDLFVELCKESAIPEKEYIKVLIAAGYAKSGSALDGWNSAVDVYLMKRAGENFDTVLEYIDRYDEKYTKYGVLIKVNAHKTLEHLVSMLIYGKKIAKTAIRDVLMDHGELAEPLMQRYMHSNAHERAAMLRVLMLYRNQPGVGEFIADVAASDKSKTVRSVLSGAAPHGIPGKKIKNAPLFFETVMAEGSTLSCGEWQEILGDSACAAVADRIFFYTPKQDGLQVLVYNDGEFLDMTDRPFPLKQSDRIGVLHPLDVPSGCDVLSLRISQPFKQIERKIYMPISVDNYYSEALNGSLTSRTDFDAALKKTGFIKCGKRSASEPDAYVVFIGDYAAAVRCDFSGSSDTVACGNIFYYNRHDVVKLNRMYYISTARSLALSDLPRREFSELTLRCYSLFGRD